MIYIYFVHIQIYDTNLENFFKYNDTFVITVMANYYVRVDILCLYYVKILQHQSV